MKRLILFLIMIVCIPFALADTQIIKINASGDMQGYGIVGAYYVGQTFNYTGGSSIVPTNLLMNQVAGATGGTCWFELRGATAGLPNTTIYAKGTNYSCSSTGLINSSVETVYENLPNATIVPLALVLNFTAMTGTPSLLLSPNGCPGIFSQGTEVSKTTSNASSWSIINSASCNDLYVEVYGNNAINFSITAKNNITNTLINNFSASITFINSSGSSQSINYNSSAAQILTLLNNSFVGLINITVSASNYSSRTYTNYNVSGNLIAYLNPVSSALINIYDENTNQLITNTNFSVQFISSTGGYNYTTTNGTLYATLITPNTYTVLYSAPGYQQRSYAITITNSDTSYVNIYTSNLSTYLNITVSVVDQNNNPIENALVYVNKYSSITNTFQLVSIVQTNYQGYGVFQGILNTQYYSFQVYYPTGTIRKSTEKTFLFTSPITLQINTQDVPLDRYYASLLVLSSLTFDTTLNQFSYVYSDPAGILTKSCLDLYAIKISGNVFLNQTCVNAAAGSMSVGVINTSGSIYLAKTSYYYNTAIIQGKSLQKQFASTAMNLGLYGVFLTVFLMITFAFLGKDNPQNAIILTGLPLGLCAMLGIILLSWQSIIGIFAVYIVIIYILGRRS